MASASFQVPKCQAEEFAEHLHPSEEWDSLWYYWDHTKEIKKPSFFPSDASWIWRGHGLPGQTNRTTAATVLFSDLSICWFKIDWDTSARNTTLSRLSAFRPPHHPFRLDLIDASRSYGTQLAQFAQAATQEHHLVGSGDSRALVAEALERVENGVHGRAVGGFDTAFGYLLYEGGQKDGRWYGADHEIRPGDVLQWKSARFSWDVPGRGAWEAKTVRQELALGDPHHTAIAMSSAPLIPAVLTSNVPVIALPNLDLIDQTPERPPRWHVGSPPLSALQSGSLKIYRPIGEALIGCPVDAVWPPRPVAGVVYMQEMQELSET